MKIEHFYKSIQDHNITTSLIIFKNSENSFIADQYINEIASQHSLEKMVCECAEDINIPSSTFAYLDTPVLQVCRVDKFDYVYLPLKSATNTVIVCNSISPEAKKLYSEYIIEIPKLEDWQIKDYAASQLEGLPEKSLDWLLKICGKDIMRLDLEIDRLKIFDEVERNNIMKGFYHDSIYDDLSSSSVFDFIQAVTTKNTDKIKTLYKELDKLDSSPMGILALLYNNFKNIILVQCAKVQSAELLGIPERQFWAIKKNINHYTNEQLQHIFITITDIDKKIKTGEIEVKNIVDYLLLDILSC